MGITAQTSKEERMSEAAVLVIVVVIQIAVLGYLIGALIRSIQKERRSSNIRNIWGNFGLSLALLILFLTSWIGQAVAEWQVYANEQREHEQPVEFSDYLVEFGQSTMENWQSEFLQLFSFVLLAALLVHRGSAESKDSDERMEQALQRIEQKLGTK
jgi:hypothetical protein